MKITTKGVQEAVEAYCQNQGEEASNGGEKRQKPYLKMAFIDAIVKFIVADDQVLILCWQM
jgi:hypothetical protein